MGSPDIGEDAFKTRHWTWLVVSADNVRLAIPNRPCP